MVTDKFRPGDERHPEPKHGEVLEKGQDVLKAEKKEIKFSHHTIKNGETLSEICQQYGIPLKALYAVNQHELDPKIMEKDGKIAYGAPTYHVGDKLNIPSQSDVPNAVKYFDQWAKAVVAKQRLEKPESPTAQKPAGSVAEKPISRTQILDDEHLAAKNAALMAKVAIETKYNQFRTQHEGQGSLDDAWDWMKKTAGLGDSSADIERDFKNQRGMVDLMMKAAKNENLVQFKNLYKQCTGKNYNQSDFLQATKKPTSLAFEDLSEKYRQSQEAGNRGIQLGAAGLVAATAFIPGAAPVSLPLAGRIAVGAGLGAIASGAADYANKGETRNLLHSTTDGALVGGSVALSIPIAGAAEAGVLAAGANVATKYAPTVRVMAGLAGGAAGGSAAGGIIDGSLTAKHDAREGKFDPVHIAQKTGEGIVTGAVIGGPIGATGPLLKNVINIPKAASAEATTAAESEIAAATTAVEKPVVPTKASAATETQPPPQDFTKGGSKPTDVNKGTATQSGDVAKTGSDVPKDSSATWQKGSTHDVKPVQKPTSDDAVTQGTQDKTAATTQTDSTSTSSTTKDSGNWQQGSTHDMPASQKPDVSKYAADVKKPPELTPEEVWAKKLDNLETDPLVKTESIKPLELQNGWKGVQYERKIGGRIVQESFNPKDGSRVLTEEFKDGMGIKHREVRTTSANGKEVTNKFRLRQGADGLEQWVPISNKWENHLLDLRRDHHVKQLEEIPMGNDWSKVRYEKNGRQIEEAARGSDGARYKKVEYTDHRGVPNREVSTTSAEGKTITNKFKLDQSGEWKFISKTGAGKPSEAISPEAPAGRPPDSRMQWAKEKIDAGVKWTEDKLKSLRSDTHASNIREVELKQGWKAVEYTDANGAKITEAYNPANGSKHTIRDYKENGVRFQEDTLEVPSDGLKLWRKQKEFRKLSTGLEDEAQPQFEWRTIDTKREVVSKTPTD